MTQRENVRLIVCCDGTWQQRKTVASTISGKTQTSSEGSWYTNVALLSRAIDSGGKTKTNNVKTGQPTTENEGKSKMKEEIESEMRKDEKRQIVFYQSGIGTDMDHASNVIQGATGLGLFDKVQEAYGFLADNYVGGDEIFLFGFSRGSYTARCVGGFINWAGILPKSLSSHFPAIFTAYQRRKPNDLSTIHEAEEQLLKFTGMLPSADASKTSRIDGSDVDGREHVSDDDDQGSIGRVQPPPIRFIGVFDTVGALGVPGRFGDADIVELFSFFDPGLAPNVDYAIQALSLSEDREDFLPSIFYQPEDRQKQRKEMGKPEQVLKQVWFNGSHTDVGGGFAAHGLSDISLAFMVSNLLDTPDGKPLCRIDLDVLKDSQDRRLSWGRQESHKSRSIYEHKATRQVGVTSLNKDLVNTKVWKTQVVNGSTVEELHHSVVISEAFTKESPQFVGLLEKKGGSEIFSKMWHRASHSESLGRTENFLRWEAAEPDQVCDSGEIVEEEEEQKRMNSLLSYAGGVGGAIASLSKVVLGPLMYDSPRDINKPGLHDSNLKPGPISKAFAGIKKTLFSPAKDGCE